MPANRLLIGRKRGQGIDLYHAGATEPFASITLSERHYSGGAVLVLEFPDEITALRREVERRPL